MTRLLLRGLLPLLGLTSGLCLAALAWGRANPGLVLAYVDQFRGHLVLYDARTALRLDFLPALNQADVPQWSRDGRWLAFLHAGEVWVAASDASSQHQITPLPDPPPGWKRYESLYWSQDGQTLTAYRQGLTPQTSGIVWAGVGVWQAAPMDVDHPQAQAYMAQLADGQAAQSHDLRLDWRRSGDSVALVVLDGPQARPLRNLPDLQNGAALHDVTWEPDGRHLLLTLEDPATGVRRILRVPTDGQSASSLLIVGGYAPAPRP